MNAERGPSYTVDNSAPSYLTPIDIQGHPNFVLETVELPFHEQDGLSVCTIENRGDLLHKCYLVITLPKVTGKNIRWCTDVGFALVEKLKLEIGGQTVDEQTGEFMYIWNSLTLSGDEAVSLSDMVNAEDFWKSMDELSQQKVYVPLNFTFCDDSENALPLACLAFHKVNIVLTERSFESMLEGDVETIHEGGGVNLSCDYITLDTVGRNDLLDGCPRHYLINQTQTNVIEKWAGKHELMLSDECVELFVVCRSLSPTRTPSDRFKFADEGGKNPIRTGVLTLDDERIELTGKFMNVVQPFQYHTGCAPVGVNVLSFCLHPEQNRASGSCNMSRIRNLDLELDLNPDEDWEVVIYARSHAIMSISSGMVAIRGVV
jgi:hypothetical protein